AVTPRTRSLPVQPTQIYSTIDGLLLCLLLVCYAPFRRRDGEVFALLMSIYPVTRFLVESLRSDEAPALGTGLTISQNVSLMLLICAAALWLYVLRQPQGTAFG
ncbi:MAG: prolipoprotein diacylglyceryl transferase family protein, partial [Thermoguttaceae bacterium]